MDRRKDFVSLGELSSDELWMLLELAKKIKAHPEKYRRQLEGKTLAMIFEKPSLRTRVSFEVGIQQLGGHGIYLSPSDINLGKRESVYDIAKNLERMVHGIEIRTFAHENVTLLAEYAGIPVINGLSDFSHPCQGLGDYLTIREKRKDLQKLKISYIGDGNNVAHSLIFGAAKLGLHLWIATPENFEPRREVVDQFIESTAGNDGELHVTHDPISAAKDADVIYTDVWASMGQEAQFEERKKIFMPYQVNRQLVDHAKKDYLFMHCLPAKRGLEVTDEVIDSANSIVFDQAENRLHIQKAIMVYLMADKKSIGFGGSKKRRGK